MPARDVPPITPSFGDNRMFPPEAQRMSAFRDHFSHVAPDYAAYRPRYPDALLRWLAMAAGSPRRAWDCGSGSGQAATAMATWVHDVVATDASLAQLASAASRERVWHVAMRAEAAALRTASIDLVTVAQALHWFDPAAFFAEADRVLRPGGLLAVWSYGLHTLSPRLDEILARFYHETLGPYWPAERTLVDTGYSTIALPYPEIEVPPFAMEAEWTLAQLSGYLSTWSAVSRYRESTGASPVPDVVRQLRRTWGRAPTRRVRWPLMVRAAMKPL